MCFVRPGDDDSTEPALYEGQVKDTMQKGYGRLIYNDGHAVIGTFEDSNPT